MSDVVALYATSRISTAALEGSMRSHTFARKAEEIYSSSNDRDSRACCNVRHSAMTESEATPDSRTHAFVCLCRGMPTDESLRLLLVESMRPYESSTNSVTVIGMGGTDGWYSIGVHG